MDNLFFLGHQWSDWNNLIDKLAKERIPSKPGIYEIRTDHKFGRLNGESQILSIGKAEKSLRSRLAKGRLEDLIKNLNRPEKWLYNAKQSIQYHYIAVDSNDSAKWLEATRQWEYESEYWELPPGNDRLEKAPILKRIKQHYPGFNEGVLKNLLGQYQNVEKVANVLGVPSFIINNLMVYWMIKVT